ncbi:hypothetical protein OUZ56_008284 [Daphnia magna]|uniref:Endonuclease/exonuclease/phosphatase domain-containing protein n=1 Tax=Daphnia magna TaxID=35525 RepID=A0ABR0ACN2_9CRUS|nr:hypothetical protein OUZ56_008284 [Daphnia magna]
MRYAANKRYVAERDANQVTANKESAENVKENDMGNVEVNCGLVNAQSLFHKRDELKEKIEKSNFDFVTVTETWKIERETDLKEACPEGFKFKYQPRKDERQGGGIALFYRDSIKSSPRSRKHYETFECLETSLDVGAGRDIRLINIYRPPESNKIEFLEEFESLLSKRSKEKLFITGDLNLHVENPKSSRVKEFLKLIKSHGLVQHVKKPTHEDGGTLDLIITTPDLLVKNVEVGDYFSDHKFVQCRIQTEKKKEDIIKKEE